jgi:hypothetical protein
MTVETDHLSSFVGHSTVIRHFNEAIASGAASVLGWPIGIATEGGRP